MKRQLRVFAGLLVAGFAVAAAQSGAQADMIGLYTFNDGTASDVSGNGNHATANTATFVPLGGPNGDGAFDFSSNATFMTLPININPGALPTLTMGAFVRADTAGGNNGAGKVISHDNGSFDRSLGLDFRSGQFGIPNTNIGYAAFTGFPGVLRGAPVSFPEPAFRLVVASYDGTTVTLNDNGAISTATDFTDSGSGLTTTRIGGNPTFGEFFDGIIDNVFFFDEVLSATEIAAIRTGGTDHLLSLAQINTAPEPGTLTLLAVGLAGAGYLRRRRKY